MTGKRKLVTCAMGLVSLLLLAWMARDGMLTDDGLDTLAWATFALTGTALGANVGEHYASRSARSPAT